MEDLGSKNGYGYVEDLEGEREPPILPLPSLQVLREGGRERFEWISRESEVKYGNIWPNLAKLAMYGCVFVCMSKTI